MPAQRADVECATERSRQRIAASQPTASAVAAPRTVPRAGSLRGMDARSLARLQALGRLGFGAGLVARARRAWRGGWVGGVADRRDGQALAIGLGARDVALALGALRALRSGRGAAPWLRAGMLADAADLVATLRARDSAAAARGRRPSPRSPAARCCSVPGCRAPSTSSSP